MRTEKSRFRRSLARLRELMQMQRHLPIPDQAANLNRAIRGHYAYYGIAGNFRALQRVYRTVERYWHRMLCSRSRKGHITWDVFHQIKARTPIMRPKLFLSYAKLQSIAVL
jgi:RNA-directed DNA polymerase